MLDAPPPPQSPPSPLRREVKLGRWSAGLPPRLRMLRGTLQLSDLAAMTGAFCAATLLVPFRSAPFALHEFLSMRLKVSNFAIFLAMLLVWHACFQAFRLYDESRPLLDLRRLRDVPKAVSLGTGFLWICGSAFQIFLVSPPFLAVFLVAGTAGVAISRIGLRVGLQLLFRGPALRRHILIAGTGPQALRFAREIEENPETGYWLIGFADGESSPWMEDFRRSGRRLACDVKNFRTFLRDHVVDEVVVALPLEILHRYRAPLIGPCEVQGLTVRFLSSVFDDPPTKDSPGRDYGASVVMTVYHGTLEGWPAVIKRASDVALSALFLVASAPVLLAAYALIFATSRGPVLFVQDRIGLNGRRFRMYKFRTMIPGAADRIEELTHLNETDGPVFKLREDPRITRVGRFLRASSIDELPQLWNVLKGEMSLVGPRPLPVRDVEGFDEDRYRRRFSVRPGLTGLWQVSGRSAIPFERWMGLDLQYVEEWSLGLDARILLDTIPAVLSGTGAS